MSASRHLTTNLNYIVEEVKEKIMIMIVTPKIMLGLLETPIGRVG
jgi:hypothetical protein